VVRNIHYGREVTAGLIVAFYTYCAKRMTSKLILGNQTNIEVIALLKAEERTGKLDEGRKGTLRLLPADQEPTPSTVRKWLTRKVSP